VLTSSITYYVHTMSEDDAGNSIPGNQSTVATSGSFTTA